MLLIDSMFSSDIKTQYSNVEINYQSVFMQVEANVKDEILILDKESNYTRYGNSVYYGQTKMVENGKGSKKHKLPHGFGILISQTYKGVESIIEGFWRNGLRDFPSVHLSQDLTPQFQTPAGEQDETIELESLEKALA